MQPANQHIMEYAPPDVRSPSPSTSVGSTHPEDQTSYSDSEDVLAQDQFEKKWADKIGLGKPSQQEISSNDDPLMDRPEPDSVEEMEKFEKTVTNLRNEVRLITDNEMFENTLLQGSKAALETPIHTRDVDIIMQSMMGPSSSSSTFPTTSTPFASPAHSRPQPRPSTFHPDAHVDVTNGPWNDPEVTRGGFGAGMDSFVGVPHSSSMGPAGMMMMPQPPPPQPDLSAVPGSGRRRGRSIGTGRRQ